MFNLLLVDDEPIIVDSLYRLVTGLHELPLNVRKTCSAQEAIETMEENPIDILMTDVKMPGMSGLELSALVKRRWPKCKTIFLSGYSNFAYLQTALHQEAFDYLLKPVDDETVIETLHKIFAVICEEQLTEEKDKQMGVQLKKAQDIINQELLDELITKPLTEQQLNDRIQAFRDASLQPDSNLILLIGRADRWPRSASDLGNQQPRYAICKLVEDFLNPHCTIVSIIGQRYMVWILQPLDREEEQGINDLLQLHWFIGEEMERVQATILKRLELPCSFVVSGPVVEWAKIYDTHKNMCELLDRGIGLSQEILWLEQTPDVLSRYDDSVLLPQDLRRQLLGLTCLLEEGDLVTLQGSLYSFFEMLQQSIFLNNDRQSEIFLNLSVIFLAYMNTRQITQEIGLSIDLTYLSNFNKHTDWHAFGNYCLRLAELLLLLVGDDVKKQKKDIIEKVDAHIVRYLNRNLTLQQLAEHVHLSQFYLSRLYHAQKGYPISQRIKELKLIRARELLLQDGIKIKDVAGELGFENVPYFTTFFRKCVGMSPKEYIRSNKV